MVKEYYYSKSGNIKLSEHFSLKEFKSQDGTDLILVSEELINMLEILRKELNCSKIKINSGYRSSKYDKEVGGSGSGYHTKGMAADIQCYDQNNKIIDSKYVCTKSQTLGFNGICYISSIATHLDVRSYKYYLNEKTNKKVDDWFEFFDISLIPYNVNDIIYPKEDIILYSNILKNGEQLKIKKNKKCIVRLIKGNFMCLGDDDIKYFYPAGWTDEYDKFTKTINKILIIKDAIFKIFEMIYKIIKKISGKS